MSAGVVAECPRCRAILRRTQRHSLDRTIAWLTAGLILYAVAVSFPFLSMRAKGISNETAMTSGIIALFNQGMDWMGLVVLLTCIIFPLFTMAGLLYVLVPIRLGRRLPLAAPLFAFTQRLRHWGMMEVYLLAILVSMVKLAKMAHIIAGPSLFSFVTLIFVLAAASVSLDSHLIWDYLQSPLVGDSFQSPLEGDSFQSSPGEGSLQSPLVGDSFQFPLAENHLHRQP
jgi:paraquat-inducible protein A